mgnify:CR=1 FL=1
MKTIGYLLFALLPVAASAATYPVDIDQQLNGAEVTVTPQVIDRDLAGQRAAERLSARATEVGIAVRVVEPRLGDFNDDLRANGKKALRQHLAGQIGPEDWHRLTG